jgi:hypothetical protein
MLLNKSTDEEILTTLTSMSVDGVDRNHPREGQPNTGVEGYSSFHPQSVDLFLLSL